MRITRAGGALLALLVFADACREGASSREGPKMDMSAFARTRWTIRFRFGKRLGFTFIVLATCPLSSVVLLLRQVQNFLGACVNRRDAGLVRHCYLRRSGRTVAR